MVGFSYHEDPDIGRSAMGRVNFTRKDNMLTEYTACLYPREDQEERIRHIRKKRRQTMLVLAVLLTVVWLICYFTPEEDEVKEGLVTRQDETYEKKILVEGETAEGTWQKEISLEIPERVLSEDEKEKLKTEAKTYLDQNVAGRNPSLSEVRETLCFPQSIPSCGAAVQWIYDEEYIEEDGRLKKEAVPDEGVDTEITAEVSYMDWKESFSYPVHLMPVLDDADWLQEKELYKALQTAVEEQKEQKQIKLPTEINETAVRYESEEAGGRSYEAVYVLLAVILLLPLVWHRQMKGKMEFREEQMLQDHPEIVNKIMLLMGAGLTVSKAVERLCAEYEETRKKQAPVRYAYEELCIANQEMRDGKPESLAIEAFGRRCHLMPYMRFASIVSQNIKKGAQGLLEILEKESLEALEQRKALALAQGEKMGTKLLFPMILMLGLVMAMIMLPAFMSI